MTTLQLHLFNCLYLAVLVILGQSVMRLAAGPARADRLARRPWKTA